MAEWLLLCSCARRGGLLSETVTTASVPVYIEAFMGRGASNGIPVFVAAESSHTASACVSAAAA